MGKDRKYFVHETSIVEEPCQIGEGTRIWHFCHVMPNSTIGKNCNIGQNAFVGANASIGNRVKIQNNVSIYSAVTLEDDVFCGPSCVFTDIRTPRAFISRKNEFLPILVKQGATIGANATVVPCYTKGLTIGRYALVGAGSVVTKDVPDHALVYGNPGRVEGWVCNCGITLEFNQDSQAQCAKCGNRYKQKHGKIISLVVHNRKIPVLLTD